jgi:hypothetical protein
MVDWDFNSRVQTVEVIDLATNTILDTRTVSGFTGGQYLVWNIQGSVVFRVTRTGGSNGVVSGLFVDPVGGV